MNGTVQPNEDETPVEPPDPFEGVPSSGEISVTPWQQGDSYVRNLGLGFGASMLAGLTLTGIGLIDPTPLPELLGLSIISSALASGPAELFTTSKQYKAFTERADAAWVATQILTDYMGEEQYQAYLDDLDAYTAQMSDVQKVEVIWDYTFPEDPNMPDTLSGIAAARASQSISDPEVQEWRIARENEIAEQQFRDIDKDIEQMGRSALWEHQGFPPELYDYDSSLPFEYYQHQAAQDYGLFDNPAFLAEGGMYENLDAFKEQIIAEARVSSLEQDWQGTEAYIRAQQELHEINNPTEITPEDAYAARYQGLADYEMEKSGNGEHRRVRSAAPPLLANPFEDLDTTYLVDFEMTPEGQVIFQGVDQLVTGEDRTLPIFADTEQAEADLYYIQTMAEELGGRQYTIGFDIVYNGPAGGSGGGSGGGGESSGDGGGGGGDYGGGGGPSGGETGGGASSYTPGPIAGTVDSGSTQMRGGGGIFAFAEGGRAPGGLALVGEEGPELVHLPGGSLLTPADETRALFAALPDGGGVTYNTIYLDVEVNGVQDAERLVKELRRELRAQGMDFAEVR